MSSKRLSKRYDKLIEAFKVVKPQRILKYKKIKVGDYFVKHYSTYLLIDVQKFKKAINDQEIKRMK